VYSRTVGRGLIPDIRASADGGGLSSSATQAFEGSGAAAREGGFVDWARGP